MSTGSIRVAVLASSILASLGPPAAADRIVTKSGKVLEGKATVKEDGSYRIELKTVTIDLAKDIVKEVLIEGDMATYVPKNEKEKEALAKGLVFYNGQWITKEAYKQAVDKELARRKKLLEEESKHLQFADGWKFETAHFQFQGNCPKDVLDDLASLMEEYYAVMNSKIGIKASPALQRKKMTVNVFRNKEDYVRVGGAPSGTGGYFSNLQEALNFYYDFEDPGFTRQVMLHEATHLLTYLSNPKFDAPAWINEGMAEYFGSSRITGDKGKRKMEPGQILDNRLLVLQDMEKQNYIPIDKWLEYSTSYGAVERAGGNTYQHYSYWWAFCHFLATNKKYEKKFLQYFKDLYALQGFDKKVGYGGMDTGGVAFSVEPKEYIAKLLERLGVRDIQKLDEEFRAWIRSTEPVGARGYFYVGRDLTMMRKYDEGLANLDIAIQKGYDTAECYAMRARCYEGKRQVERANADWRKAIEQNPVEPSYRMELASNLLLSKATREQGIEQLRIAAELDPLDPWIRYRLEEAEKRAGGPAEADAK